MNFQKLKKNSFFKIALNKYVLILAAFVIWMLFFDENSYLAHQKFNKEIQKLKTSIQFYKNKISEDKETIKNLQDSVKLQRFAREKYLMKKENEDIYIIEFDTLK